MAFPPKSQSPSPHSSPEPSTLSKPSFGRRSDYFGDALYESPPASDYCDSVSVQVGDGNESGTDSTLDDFEDAEDTEFGHPLQRMPRLKSADHGLHYDSDAAVKELLNSSRSSQSSLCLSDDDTINFDRIIDILLDQKPNPFDIHAARNLVFFDSPLDDKVYRYQESLPPLMIKRFKISSPEIRLLLELNVPEAREDPWNASPHILKTVEREDYVYLCMQRLFDYNNPPLISVAHYIDFFRQVLEGLSFLHEQHISGLNCADPSSYMVDLSSSPHTPAPLKDATTPPLPQFDRFSFPVRYYFANFSQATRIYNQSPSTSSPSSPGQGGTPTRTPNPFQRDVQDCGALFDSLLFDVPQVAPKFKSLTKAMTMGGFTADDARRLFEALCRSLDADLFEKSASARPIPERAYTLAHLAVKSRSFINSREYVASR